MNSKLPKQPIKSRDTTSLGVTYSESSDLWIGAFRYYLGRTTASVHSFCNSLVKNWEFLPEMAQTIVKRDLLEAIHRDDLDRDCDKRVNFHSSYKTLGHDCDSACWRGVYARISGGVNKD